MYYCKSNKMQHNFKTGRSIKSASEVACVDLGPLNIPTGRHTVSNFSMNIHSFIHLSIHAFIHSSIHSAINPSIHPSHPIFIPFSPSIKANLSTYPSIHYCHWTSGCIFKPKDSQTSGQRACSSVESDYCGLTILRLLKFLAVPSSSPWMSGQVVQPRWP